MDQPEQKQVPMWIVSIIGGSFTFYTTTLAPALQSLVGNSWIGTEDTCRPANQRTSSVYCGTEAIHSFLKFLLGHSLFSNGLLQNCPWTLMGDSTTHMQELSLPASTTSDPVSELPYCMGWKCQYSADWSPLHRSNDRLIHITGLSERLVVILGFSNYQKIWK